MGKVLSLMGRPLKTYNIESRAHKIISMEKPKPAPKYEANVKELEMILKENPNIVKEYANKNMELEKRLKEVYVSSTDPIIKDSPFKSSTSRPLPSDRSIPRHTDYGIEIPEAASPGFITIRELFQLIAEYKRDKNIDKNILALKYKLPKETIEDLLKYYGSFDVIEPRTKDKKFNPQALYQQIGTGYDIKKI